MGLRFRKSIRLLPGVRWNISKTGTSLSLGGKGLTVNLGRKGTRTTLGLPGSGLSHSTYKPYKKSGSLLSVLLILTLIGVAVYWAAS